MSTCELNQSDNIKNIFELVDFDDEVNLLLKSIRSGHGLVLVDIWAGDGTGQYPGFA